jgi:hypothetical protein
MGALTGEKAGEDAVTELVPWDAIDVAAVDVRVLTVPELVDDDVSLLRLSSVGLDGSEFWPSSSSACCLSLSFSSCRRRW